MRSTQYAPVDYVNYKARIIILGVTPGWQQARLAFETAIALRGTAEDILGLEIKRRAAFAGTMRKNLVSMLDDLAIHKFLGISSTANMFMERADLLHSTSALRYPVFRNGTNFSGYAPEPSKHAFLAAMLKHLLTPELASAPDALIVPLGRSVEMALEYLTGLQLVPPDRWLRGFPHPSGANGHRKRLFDLHRDELGHAVRRWLGRPTSR